MAFPTWPEDIASIFLREGFQVPNLAQPPLATEMSGGNTRMRKLNRTRVATVRGSLRMPWDMYQRFETFLFGSLQEGTSRFNMTLWKNGEIVERVCWIEGAASGVSQQPYGADQTRVSLTLKIEDY